MPAGPATGGGYRGAGHPLHDPGAGGALLQRAGLHPPQGQLHSGQGEDENGQGLHDCAASPAPCERNFPRGGQ